MKYSEVLIKLVMEFKKCGAILAMRRLHRKTTAELMWPYILRLLKERPMYAYELRKEINRRFGWKPPLVTSYTVLYRLQRKGYVVAEREERHEGRPARKYYKITEKGEELLAEAEKYFRDMYAKLFVEKPLRQAPPRDDHPLKRRKVR